MDVEEISCTSGEDSLITTESGIPSNVLAKLRRLKIQESIFDASIHKYDYDQSDDKKLASQNKVRDWKIYSAKVRNNISVIRNMFEDIKIATGTFEENLKTIAINEIKKDILNFNYKIQTFEDFITTELKSLKLDEEAILRQMDEQQKVAVTTKGKVKIQCQQYTEVVPSPVRVLINSPLKCTEVQQFQEFMSKSKNRYGGWNEYNHNIFVQIWNKFYDSDNFVCLENNMKEISGNKLLPQFQTEVNEKLPGIKSDDIILHGKWYSEFCYRKFVQQTALDKWRDNKRKIKGRQVKVKQNKNISQNYTNEKLCRKQKETSEYRHSVFKGELNVDETEFKIIPVKKSKNNVTVKSLLPTDEEIFLPIMKESSIKIKEPNEHTVIPKLTSRKLYSLPTKQWINRYNSNSNVNEVTQSKYMNNIECVNKLCIPNWRTCLHKREED